MNQKKIQGELDFSVEPAPDMDSQSANLGSSYSETAHHRPSSLTSASSGALIVFVLIHVL